MRAVLIFLQPQLAGICIDILGDNEGAMAIANNPSSASRSMVMVTTSISYEATRFPHISNGNMRKYTTNVGGCTSSLVLSEEDYY